MPAARRQAKRQFKKLVRATYKQKNIIVSVAAIIIVCVVILGASPVPQRVSDLPLFTSNPEELNFVNFAEFYQVTKVTDGDTIRVQVGSTDVPVRLIGVDTPETVDPRGTVECFGKEASAYLTKLLEGKLVWLETDSTQADIDTFGRLLRYVYLADGTLINQKLLLEGYGYEYTFTEPYLHQVDFRQAQATAQHQRKGLWSPNTCNGSR